MLVMQLQDIQTLDTEHNTGHSVHNGVNAPEHKRCQTAQDTEEDGEYRRELPLLRHIVETICGLALLEIRPKYLYPVLFVQLVVPVAHEPVLQRLAHVRAGSQVQAETVPERVLNPCHGNIDAE